MIKFNRSQTVLIFTLMVNNSAVLPIQAAIKQTEQNSPTLIQEQYIALSWGDLWNVLTRKRRSGGSRGEVCAIAPAKLGDRNSIPLRSKVLEVWSDRPLFLWKVKDKNETVKRIELFDRESEVVLWSRDIPNGQTSIIYDGKPLQPGQSYGWRLFASFSQKQQPSFQIMGQQQRDRIAAELAQLETRLKKKGASVETILLEKANYFAQKELWSDALREIYSVPKPSPEVIATIKQIEAYDFCRD